MILSNTAIIMQAVAYHLIASSFSDLLAHKLVHPFILLIVRAAGCHEARHYERHGGFFFEIRKEMVDDVKQVWGNIED